MLELVCVKPAVIGLGYVGLPLAVEISKYYDVVGFDVNQKRIAELKSCFDATGEVSKEELERAERIAYHSKPSHLSEINFFIVTVPTPIDASKVPDLEPLKNASKLVGEALSKGSIIVFESTVYPGATEEICVPLLERYSGLSFNKDFFVGYSPERINPGDRNHRVSSILKVTSGSDEKSATFIDTFYRTFIEAGTHKAPSIKVAEAAKIIENTQRDVNIGLINELATLFDKLGIDTHAVLEAARTKWNFLPFVPGLVGGHCIGVDPYYLTHKAQQVGHHPEIISAGRRVNDNMPKFVAEKLLLALVKSKVDLQNARLLVMGVTFKENCPDIRNSKVCELIKIFKDYGLSVDVVDPKASPHDLEMEHGLSLSNDMGENYNAVIIAVNHNEFSKFKASDYRKIMVDSGLIFDLKNTLNAEDVDLRL